MKRHSVVLTMFMVVSMMVFSVPQVHAGNIFTQANHHVKKSKRTHVIPIPPVSSPYDDHDTMWIRKISVHDSNTGESLWNAGCAKGTLTGRNHPHQSIYVYAGARDLRVGCRYEVRFTDRQKRRYHGEYEVTEIHGITGFKSVLPAPLLAM